MIGRRLSLLTAAVGVLALTTAGKGCAPEPSTGGGLQPATTWFHAQVTWRAIGRPLGLPIDIDYSWGNQIEYTTQLSDVNGSWDLVKPLRAGQEVHVLATQHEAGELTCTIWESDPNGDHIGQPVSGPKTTHRSGDEVHCDWTFAKDPA